MADEFDDPENGDPDENSELAIEGEQNDALDVEFQDIPMPAGDLFAPENEEPDDEGEPAIAGEAVVAEPAPQVAEVELSPIDKFLKDLPLDSDVVIVLKRKADRAGDDFRIPCAANGHVDNLAWEGRTAEEIYADVKRTYGGGRYWFQFQYGGGMKQAWSQILFDPPGLSEVEKTVEAKKAKEREPERIPDGSQHFAAPADPPKSAFAEMKERLQEAKDIKALLGADDDKSEAPAAEKEQPSVRDLIALEMMKTTGNDPELGAQVVKKILGISDSKGEKAWSGVVWHAISHADEVTSVVQTVAGIASPFVSSFFGPPPPKTAMLTLPDGRQVPVQPGQPATAPSTFTPPPTPGITMPPGRGANPPASEEQKTAHAAPVAPIRANQAVKW